MIRPEFVWVPHHRVYRRFSPPTTVTELTEQTIYQSPDSARYYAARAFCAALLWLRSTAKWWTT